MLRSMQREGRRDAGTAPTGDPPEERTGYHPLCRHSVAFRSTLYPAMKSLQLSPGALDLATLRALWAAPARVALDPAALPAIDAAAETVRRVVAEGRVAYGINTGFGALARTRIEGARLVELQRALVRSHCA